MERNTSEEFNYPLRGQEIQMDVGEPNNTLHGRQKTFLLSSSVRPRLDDPPNGCVRSMCHRVDEDIHAELE
jgi:hypothetical protein